MGLRAAVVIASCDGACKTCPYSVECDENPNATHPFDSYCELWARKARRIHGYEDMAREHCRDCHGDCGVCLYDENCPYDTHERKESKEREESKVAPERDKRTEQQRLECLYLMVKCKFLAICHADNEGDAAKTERLRTELVDFIRREPDAKAAFDRVARDIDAQYKAQAEA